MNERLESEVLACDLTVFTPELRQAHIDLAIQLRKAEKVQFLTNLK